MVREFSEEKRDEIFRALDAIDNREWQSFMTWCGGKASEFGDWPDRIELRTHTNYVDNYHQKILDTNEMTRNQVNTVFENVEEIDTEYAGRMRECQEEIKEQIKTIQTMTEFMRSMNGGNLNMSLLTQGSVNESSINAEENDGVEILCYDICEKLSLSDYSVSECVEVMEDLYGKGYVSEADYELILYWVDVLKYAPSTDAYRIKNLMQERFDHIITTVYIYDCLQVLADNTEDGFSPRDCCEINDIFRDFGITNRNSIACLLICCAGETGGFGAVKENYNGDGDYDREERGAGCLQLTDKKTQQLFLEYMNIAVDPSLAGYTDQVADYPWESAAWFWSVHKPVDPINNPQPLNSYVMERLDDNGGELTLGIVLTAESFVNGNVAGWNTCGGQTMSNALGKIARDDSLRRIVDGDGGWYIDGEGMNCVLHIRISVVAKDHEGEDYDLNFDAPNNWGAYEYYYYVLKNGNLTDFDLK